MAKKKKINNPFKMWGSYVGAIGGFIAFAINPLAKYLSWIPRKDIILFSNITYGLVISILSGFLIGWGIHSLIRRYKK